MRFFPLLAVLGCLGALFIPPAEAQSSKAKKLMVRYVAQVAPKNLGPLIMVGGEEVVSPAFDLPQNNLSEPLVAPARSFRLQTEAKKLELAKVSLPEGGNAFIILLVPAQKGGFTPVVIQDDGGGFRPGDFYMYNVSGKPIMSRVGTTEATIPNRSGKVVRPKGAKEGRYYDVLLGVREQTGSRVISSSRWPVQEQMRTYVFFFNNPQRGDVDFRAVDEFVPPKEKEDE